MVTVDNNLPWVTQTLVDEIVTAFNNAHAVLLTGPAAIGKSHLTTKVCLQLLKQLSSTQADNLVYAGTHPDLHVLTSAYSYHQLDQCLQNSAMRYLDSELLEKKRLSRQISVDSIRSLVVSMSESAALAGNKVAVICPAESMNRNAANALLKFLEEPTDQTLIILVSHDISRLPATIRSRCMKIDIVPPTSLASVEWLMQQHADKNEDQVIDALHLASNRPLLAHQYMLEDQQSIVDDLVKDVEEVISKGSTSIVTIARNWQKLKQTDFILHWLCCFFSDLIRFKSGYAEHNNIHYRSGLSSIAERLPISNLFDFYDYLLDITKRYDGVSDEALLIEDMLLTLSAASE